MKLSEMFAKMLGDKDVELPDETPKAEPKPEPKPEPKAEPKPEPVQEPVDIALLKKQIEDLKKANLQLIMQGSLHEEQEQSDEDIIMDLCVRNRRRDGNENNTSTTEL